MTMRHVFSNAWYATFMDRSQWLFAGAIGLICAVLLVVFLVGATLQLDGTGWGPSDEIEVSDRNGELDAIWLALWMGFLVACVRAFMDSGLTSSARVVAEGGQPTSAEIRRDGFRFSLRVLGVRAVSLYMPIFALSVSSLYTLVVLGTIGLESSREGFSPYTPAFRGGSLLLALVFLVVWALCESWSQLSVRNVILSRQGVFASLRQGAKLLRARFGSAVVTASVLALVFIAITVVTLALIALSYLGLPEGPAALASWMLVFAYSAAGFVASVFFSNTWTAIVMQARATA